MMDRRVFLSSLGFVTLAAPFESQRVFRVGYLGGSPPSPAQPPLNGFLRGLRELGWVEGQNIVIEYRFAEGRYDRLPELAAELVRLKVDIIVTVATPAAVAAKNATATIPIVGISLGDPVGIGLIASLARPGGNVTGLSYSVDVALVRKQLELLKEIVPKVRRVAILSNPANPFHAFVTRDVKGAARSLGVQLQLLEARGPTEFDGAFAAMVKERVGALVIVPDQMFQLHGTRLADLVARSRLPAAYGVREYVEAGGLISYGASLPDLWRRAATYVDKILKGVKPADLPVEQPTKFELVVNMKTAKALGLTIPQSVLRRADEVIQ
jgi:putative ABC transport system substrate-binding protein